MGEARMLVLEKLQAECDTLRLRVAALQESEPERTRVEAALRESEERYRTLVANVPGAVYRSAAEHPYRDVLLSDGVLALTGYPATEFMRKDGLTFGDLTLPEDRPLVNEAVVAVLRS